MTRPDRHKQTLEARTKIGASVAGSSWRRRATDKSKEPQSPAGQWEEDFSSPHHEPGLRSIGLWEEKHNRMVWK